MTPALFRQRFALERIAGEGVVVDLETGSYFHLNASAAAAAAALEAAVDTDDAVALLEKEMGVPRSDAVRIVDSVLAGVGQAGIREEPIGPFVYRRDGHEYVLEEGGRRKLAIDPAARTLRLAAALQDLSYSMIDHVRSVTPKLLGLMGIKVLHASACTLPSGTVAFSGDSGAGKTTTMRSFVQAGAHQISEDLVVLADDQARVTFWTEGEAKAHSWAAATARRLQLDDGAAISFEPLIEVAGGNREELAEVWFFEASRRGGTRIERRRMLPAEGFLTLFRQAFLGAADGGSWRSHLRFTRTFAERIPLFAAQAPNGLDELARAARDYTTNWASYR